MSAVLKLTGLSALVVALCFGAGWKLDKSHNLVFLPPGMNLSKILYYDEDDFRTTIVVYEMPDDFAARLAEGGLAYLQGFAVVPGDGSPHKYSDWRKTPVAEDESWPTGRVGEREKSVRPSIRDYTDKYYRPSIDRHVEQMVDDALNSPGSYYDGTSGTETLIVVIPQLRSVFYAASDP